MAAEATPYLPKDTPGDLQLFLSGSRREAPGTFIDRGTRRDRGCLEGDGGLSTRLVVFLSPQSIGMVVKSRADG
jgi:hypothetical protein